MLKKARHKAMRHQYGIASPRLFALGTDIFVEAIFLNGRGLRVFVVKSADRMRPFLTDMYCCPSKDSEPSLQIFCIAQHFGWGRLAITEANMNDLLRHVGVFPELEQMLCSFGVKKFAMDEAFSACELLLHGGENESEVLETCCLLKYVELHDDTRQSINPWSIRHAAIYEKRNLKSKATTAILIRPSQDMSAVLRSVIEGQPASVLDSCGELGSLHLLMIASSCTGWKGFINYLDGQASELSLQVILSPIKSAPPKIMETILVLQKAMKRAQSLGEEIVRARHMISLNMKVIVDLLEQCRKYGDRLGAAPLDVDLAAQPIIREHQYLLENVSCLAERASTISDHLRDTLNLCNTELIMTNAASTDSSNRAILDIAKHTARETRTMKTLTIIALVFVPASFVADFLQMGYLSLSEFTRFSLLADKDMWLFVVIVLPLITFTVGIYIICECSGRAVRSRESSSNLSQV